jgi:hypothetical protein
MRHRPLILVAPHSATLTLTASLGALALLAAGCGSSKSPPVANMGTTGVTTTSATTAPAASSGSAASDTGNNPAGGPAAPFDACLRKHGLPGVFPGSKTLPPGADPNSPKVETAERTCARLLPQDAPPDMVSHPTGPLVAFARCMRKHGFPSFPDPDNQGHLSENGIDPRSPLVQTAVQICRPLADNESLTPFG